MTKTLISVTLAFLVAFPVAAQTTTPPLRGERDDLRARFATTTREAKEHFKIQREAAKQEIESRREELKMKVQAEHEKAKETIQAKREELKAKLQTLKDEKKKQRVERLHENISALNERMTNHFLAVLEKLEKVLDNIASRADKAEAHNLDVGTVRTAITEAENAIAAARSAVEAQAGKVYTFNIPVTATATTTEQNLKPAVGEARRALHADLTAVREKVKAAQAAVRKAATTLAQIPRVDETKVDDDDNATTTTTSPATSTQ